MLSPVDHRLAALWETRAHRINDKADAIAEVVGEIVVRARNEMLAATSLPTDFNTFKRIERIYRRIIPDVIAYLDAVLPGFVRYSEADARKILIKTVPRSWWRVKWPGLTEHMGPGDHPSGTSQDVHGKGGGGKTDSDAFKKWFGKSKVVDDNGDPLIVYHGTNATFTTFRSVSGTSGAVLGYGYYFTTDAQRAAAYAQAENANILPVYLSAQNPFEVHGKITQAQSEAIGEELKKTFGSDVPLTMSPRVSVSFSDKNDAKAFFDAKRDEWKVIGGGIDRTKPSATATGGTFSVQFSDSSKVDIGTDAEVVFRNLYAAAGPDSSSILKAAGFDSVRRSDEWVVFDANQIKSATGNRGTFDPESSDINEAESPRSSIDKLFGPQNFSLDDLIGKEPVSGKPVSADEFRKLMDQMLLPPLTEAQVEEIVKSPNPHTGDTYQERLTKLSNKVTQPEQVAGEIVTSMTLGEDVKGLRNRIDKHVGKLHGSSMRIARTEARRVAEKANVESMEQALGDLLDGWQVTAVLDERTRPHHAARHGTVYRKGGDPAYEEKPELPDEPNCRCTLIPVLKTPDEVAANPYVAQTFKNNAGSRIPDPVAYADWFRTAPVALRKKAVGVRRYDVVSKQKPNPEWSDFIGPDGKLVPVVTLKQGGQAAIQRQAEVAVMLTHRRQDFLAITQAPFVPAATRSIPTAVQAVLSLTTSQQRQLKRLAQRILTANVTDPKEQLRLARAIAPGKSDAELRQLIDLAIAGFFGGR